MRIEVGYGIEGALSDVVARRIIDGANEVNVLGEEIPVRARVHTINGFSAHAGRSDLIDWHRRTGTPSVTFLVHGETEARDALAGALGSGRVERPALHQRYDL